MIKCERGRAEIQNRDWPLSGRSGTASLTSLLDRQAGGTCFHDMNPSCAVFSGNPQPHLNAISEFQKLLRGGDWACLSIDYSRPYSVRTYEKLEVMLELSLIGDIAYYYLNYVDDLLHVAPACVFICIKRDRGETVSGWLKKSFINRWRLSWLVDMLKCILKRTLFYTECNYWYEHDGSQ